MRAFLRRRWIDGTINGVALLATAYLTVATLLSGQDQPDDTYWDAWNLPFILRLAAVGYIALFGFWKWYDARKEKEERESAQASAARNEARADLAVSCQQVAAHLHAACPDVAITDIAAQVWVPRSRDGAEVIERVVRFVLWNRPDSGVVYTEGKGVVGRAWRDKAPFSFDLACNLYPHLAGGREHFDALPEEDRLGMTFDEVQATKAYTGIVARPLFDPGVPGRFLGLFVVDYRGADHFDCVARAMDEDHATLAVIAACQTVLKKGYGSG